MQFTYQAFEIEFSSGTKRTQSIWRPVIEIILLKGEKFVGYPVIIDSGADYNIFHAEVADILGINLTKGDNRDIFGLGNQKIKGYEHNIQIKIPGLKTYTTAAVFSKKIPEHAFGVLGNTGFFDHFKVVFDYKKKIIEVI